MICLLQHQCNVAVTSLAKSAVNEKIAKKILKVICTNREKQNQYKKLKVSVWYATLLDIWIFNSKIRKKTNSWFQYFV